MKIEIRVCTNRTCRKQGSLDIFQVLTGIAPPHVSVVSCGCLGRCGAGPNVVVLPKGVFLGHCGTPIKAANMMSLVCGTDCSEVESSPENCLKALALRKRAEDEMSHGNFSLAYNLLSQAIDLNPFGGVHILYKDRSAARLATGDTTGALEDATKALTLAPNYHEAYICHADALMAMDQFEAAEESYSVALELEPSIRRSKLFKARIANLREKVSPANLG
ncbi:tetratricopeptide repeat (TPR)-containing protein [Forsythia ovata]|uniref:Tetratricopeptide repeat (TPR)-containing protein n=1 Tax=Forsythia ovata TaxID=205694 RepID=A0ABD1QRK6_9LAMI